MLRTTSAARTPDLGVAAPEQPPGTIGFVLYGAVPAGDLTLVLDVVEAVRSLTVEALPGVRTTAAVTVAGDPSTADHVQRVHQAVQELSPARTGDGAGGPTPLALVPAPAADAGAGELGIDLAARRVTVDGRELALTYLEYELLVFLTTHEGRVFSRGQLLQQVWGYDHVVGGRTVDVHVKRLRAKLGGTPHGRIETVRGVGYRFAGAPRIVRA